MSYLRDWAKSLSATATTTHTAVMPTHATNDGFVWVVFKFSGTGGFSTPSGWDERLDTGRMAIFTKVAASSSETAPSTTISSSTVMSYMLAVGDVDTADLFEAVASATEAGPRITTGITTTTAANNCFLIAVCGVNTANAWPVNGPGSIYIDGDKAGDANLAVAWDFQRVAGTTPVHKWHIRSTATATIAVIALNNASGGRIPAYIDPDTSLGEIITDLSTTTTLAGVSMSGTTGIAAMGSLSLTYDAAAAVSGGINPNNSMLALTPASGTVGGFQIGFASPTGPLDLTSGRIAFSFTARDAADCLVDLGSTAQTGALVSFNTGTNYRAFQYVARDSSPTAVGRQIAVIDVNQSDTDYAESGTPPTVSSIDGITFAANAASADMTLGIGISELHKVNTLQVAGGDSTTPIDVVALETLGTSFRLPVISRTGAAALLSYTPIKVGGGDPVQLNLDGFALQWPRAYSTATKQLTNHVSDNANGINVAAYLTADMIKMTNGVLASPSPWYFTVDASATSAATWSFSGLTLSGPGVTTLRNVTTYTGMTFANRTTITTANACTLVNCTLTGTANTPDFSGDTLTNITITPVSGGTCAAIDTSTAITGTLNANGSSSVGVECSTAGTYDFTGLVWSGFTGSNYVNVTATSGTFTFNAAGSLATNKVTVASNAVVLLFDQTTTTIKHTSLPDGTRYQVWNITASNEMINDVISGGSGFTQGFTSGVATSDVIRLRAAYMDSSNEFKTWEASLIATLGGTVDFSATEAASNSTYANYGIDGSTVTEFSTDFSNVQVDISDLDYQTLKKALFSWLLYTLTTADGIRNWWGVITAQDDANLRINSNVVNLKIENNSGQVVRFTDKDIYLFASDDSSLAASTGDGIILDNGKVYQLETGVSGLTSSESIQLMSIPTNTASNLAIVDINVDTLLTRVPEVVASASNLSIVDGLIDTILSRIGATIQMGSDGIVAVNIKKVNDVTITGGGIAGSDEWRPA